MNSAKRFLRKRFRSFDRSRLKLNTTLSMNLVVGWELSFTEDLS
ncbi:hypothetical protein [Leptospira noguchii]